MSDHLVLTDDQRLAWVRYLDPEPPDIPGNLAWDYWKIRDDERKRKIRASAGDSA